MTDMEFPINVLSAMTMTHDPILEDVERYLAQSGLTPTAFGKAALGDPKFVFDLRDGRECRRATRERARAFMHANPPGAAQPPPAQAAAE